MGLVVPSTTERGGTASRSEAAISWAMELALSLFQLMLRILVYSR